MNSTNTTGGNGEAVATSVGLTGGDVVDRAANKITQESIDAYLASSGKCWNDGKTTLEGIRLAEQIAKRHRWHEYGEMPAPFRFATEIMAAWPDEPANQ